MRTAANPLGRDLALTRDMRFLWVLAGAVAVLGCDRGPKRLDPVPAALEPRVAAADAAILDLKKTLSAKLMASVKSGGLENGIDACAGDARNLTAEVAGRHKVKIGRTSHRLRNPEHNAPRPWLGGYLEEAAKKKASELRPAVYDLGSSLGVVQALPTQALCVGCHGDPSGIPPAVKQSLAKRYPQDRATGFAEGDVRGVVWVEIEKEPR